MQTQAQIQPCGLPYSPSMDAIKRLIGEPFVVDERQYIVAGYSIAGTEVLIRAVNRDCPSTTIELPLPALLSKLFRDPAVPKPDRAAT